MLPPLPATTLGRVPFDSVPLPSCPSLLKPQQRRLPSASSAHVCDVAPPATTFARPATGAGVERVVVVPSPSWPSRLPPQQRTEPSASSAHVCSPPAQMAVAL